MKSQGLNHFILSSFQTSRATTQGTASITSDESKEALALVDRIAMLLRLEAPMPELRRCEAFLATPPSLHQTHPALMGPDRSAVSVKPRPLSGSNDEICGPSCVRNEVVLRDLSNRDICTPPQFDALNIFFYARGNIKVSRMHLMLHTPLHCFSSGGQGEEHILKLAGRLRQSQILHNGSYEEVTGALQVSSGLALDSGGFLECPGDIRDRIEDIRTAPSYHFVHES